MRLRLAPNESRMPISRWRALARASITFETLAHAAASTRPNAANTGDSAASKSNVSGFGVATVRASALTGSLRLTTRVTKLSNARSICTAVTPRFRRPVITMFRGWSAPKRSCAVIAPYIVIGMKRSSGLSFMPENSARVMPTMVSFWPLISIVEFSAAGLRLKMRPQPSSVSTATAAPPGAGVSNRASGRPAWMRTPRTSK
jgi:hypothetical protein